MASNIISSSPSYSVFVPFYLFYSVFYFLLFPPFVFRSSLLPLLPPIHPPPGSISTTHGPIFYFFPTGKILESLDATYHGWSLLFFGFSTVQIIFPRIFPSFIFGFPLFPFIFFTNCFFLFCEVSHISSYLFITS